jgi:hypothetical protein
MQYLASGLATGAPVGAGSGCVADSGDAAAIMLNATANALCAMSFLLERRHTPETFED